MFSRPPNWLETVRRGYYPANCLYVKKVEPILGQKLCLAKLGDHGVDHVRRVSLYAEVLAWEYGADPLATCIAAYCHDLGRCKDGKDDGHGLRSWEISEPVLTQCFSELPFLVIQRAIEHHSSGETAKEPITAALWDADRIDLIRFGNPPVIEKLDRNRFCYPQALELAALMIPLDLGFVRQVSHEQ